MITFAVAGVLAVHEFHVWQLAGNRIIASAHIRCHNLNEYHRIAEDVKEFFHNEGEGTELARMSRSSFTMAVKT